MLLSTYSLEDVSINSILDLRSVPIKTQVYLEYFSCVKVALGCLLDTEPLPYNNVLKVYVFYEQLGEDILAAVGKNLQMLQAQQ